jgi:hypothetical protein
MQQLRQERSRAQAEVEKLEEAISVIESLNDSGVSRKGTRATRIVSARFAAQNGAGPKGAMGAASKGIAACNKDYPGPSETYHVGISA